VSNVSQRPPIWLLLLGATFVAYFALLVAAYTVRPDPIGLNLNFRDGVAIVASVASSSQAGRAGVLRGDQIEHIDGRAVRSRADIDHLNAHLNLDAPRAFHILRNGQPLRLSLTPQVDPFDPWTRRDDATLLAIRTIQLVTLGFGVFVALRRPRDAQALLGAWVLATTGVFSIVLPRGFSSLWSQLPVAAGGPLWLPFTSTLVAGGLLFVFFAQFPKQQFRSWKTPYLVIAPLVLVVAPYAMQRIRLTYWPDESGTLLEPYARLVIAINIAYALGGLALLARAYRSLQDINERRRLRVLVIGAVVGCGAGIPILLAQRSQNADSTVTLFDSGAFTAGTIVFLVFPLSFTYAILRHRVIDLKLIVRLGLRYALARRALISVLPAIGLVFLWDVSRHSGQTLATLMSTRAAVYGGLIVLALAAHRQRQRWLDALDARFFRERYDARRLLHGLVQDLRGVDRLDAVAPLVITRIEKALHPEFVALAVRQPHDSRYRVLPGSPHIEFGDADGRVMRLLRVLGQPLDCSFDGRGLVAQLPAAERDWIRHSRTELLVPVPMPSGSIEVVMALGARRSEEPYSREDIELLETVGQNIGLLIDRIASTEDARRGADQVTSAPSLLPVRYRLGRRLGGGGMGVVYEAWDTTLNRAVAAKVMRDDLVGGELSIARFQFEATAIAQFTHPNVVTVHDFGLSDNQVAYLIMELLEGATLRQLVKDGPLAPKRVLRVVRGLASALDAAHAKGLIHRDLKPENIFIVSGGDAADEETVKVLDFGIAKSLASSSREVALTAHGALLGTPLYMAPEQLRGEEADRRWDLWALSVVTYEMITGAHPFADDGDAASAGLWDYEARIHWHLASHSAACRAFFVKALALEPEARHPSGSVFYSELEAALDRAAA
jgi:tRNA A-37 threonylcarbamoyl transferase component Bud32